MTESSPAEAEAPIEDIGDSVSEEEPTDVLEPPVFEQDEVSAFISHDGEAWPDRPPLFEQVAFLGSEPQPDEGVS